MEASEGTVLIGAKKPMNYVLATVIQFNQGMKRVVIKARGRAISKAVDVVEIVKKRFLEGEIEVKECKIGSEKIGEPGNERNISTIEIILERKEV